MSPDSIESFLFRFRLWLMAVLGVCPRGARSLEMLDSIDDIRPKALFDGFLGTVSRDTVGSSSAGAEDNLLCSSSDVDLVSCLLARGSESKTLLAHTVSISSSAGKH
jgi:hypothetical protein